MRENVPIATLRRLNKLYGNDIYPGMLLKLRSPLPSNTTSGETKPTSFASSFRMATKAHDSTKTAPPPSSSLLSAAKGPSIFFFGSSSSSGSNSNGHDKCSSSSNLSDGINSNGTSSSGSNNTSRDLSKQSQKEKMISTAPPLVVNGYFDNPPPCGGESPAGKSVRSRATSIESTPPGLRHTFTPSFPSFFPTHTTHTLTCLQ